MNCLRERRLFLLAEGEGTGDERRHLLVCPDCRNRQRSFVRAAEVAGRVLLDGPPPDVVTPRVHRAAFGWRMPVAALATALALAWLGILGHGFPSGTTTRDPGVADAALALSDVSTSLFAVEDGVWRPDQDPDASALQAALQGDWPCDGAERVLDADCN